MGHAIATAEPTPAFHIYFHFTTPGPTPAIQVHLHFYSFATPMLVPATPRAAPVPAPMMPAPASAPAPWPWPAPAAPRTAPVPVPMPTAGAALAPTPMMPTPASGPCRACDADVFARGPEIDDAPRDEGEARDKGNEAEEREKPEADMEEPEADMEEREERAAGIRSPATPEDAVPRRSAGRSRSPARLGRRTRAMAWLTD